MVALGGHHNTPLEEDILRHFILNSLRRYNETFKSKYGEMIIACDDKNYWRKEKFPYYKANRKKDREKSEIDWNAVFIIINKIKSEIRENFAYRVIQVESAEADDIIATLVKKFGNTPEKILIVSGDKDFRQLQTYKNVTQYDPVNDRYLEEKDPVKYLREHILKGDRSDGVPNFLSADDSFVMNIRQKSLMQAKIDVWITQEPTEYCDAEMLKRYKRNELMVDLSLIPESIQAAVLANYEAEAGKTNKNIFNYFVLHNLKNLMESINDFTPAIPPPVSKFYT
jgi:5'-3' exonuclease, N-terminal resolvase-like domain/T4 RNase H, C terminal